MQKVCVLAVDRAKNDAALACLKLAEEFGVEVDAFLVVSESFKNSPAYKGDEAKGYFKEICIDFDNSELVQSTIALLTNQYDFTVAHCIVENAMNDYAAIIPFIKNGFLQSPKSLELSSEKSKMRVAMRDHFPEICPKFIEIKKYENYNENLLNNFIFPVVLKPNGLTSSFLVTKCHNLQEVKLMLKNIFDKICGIYEREHGVGDTSVLIEEFIEGDMYSIDAYVDNLGELSYLPPVRVVTSYDVGLPGFYGHERNLPVDLSLEEIVEANKCVAKTVLALGLTNSTVHVEIYNTNNGWKTVELGPRIGGYRQELYKEVYGIDHFYNDILLHFGKKPIILTKPLKYAAAINIYPEKEGKILKIIGIEESRLLESLLLLKLHAQVMDEARFAINGGKYIVDGLFSNVSKVQLESDINKVRTLVNIEVESE